MAHLEKWEKELSDKVFKYLTNGRPNWDIPHTKAVVYWAKVICLKEKVDHENTKIIISSAYLHDIGYSFTKVEANYSSVNRAKDDHMLIGAQETKKILYKIGLYSDAEIIEISNIVLRHDILNRNFTLNEQILIEADSLAQLDRKRVKPNFNQADYNKFIMDYQKKRKPVFKTVGGHEILKDLWPVAKNYKIN